MPNFKSISKTAATLGVPQAWLKRERKRAEFLVFVPDADSCLTWRPWRKFWRTELKLDALLGTTTVEGAPADAS